MLLRNVYALNRSCRRASKRGDRPHPDEVSDAYSSKCEPSMYPDNNSRLWSSVLMSFPNIGDDQRDRKLRLRDEKQAESLLSTARASLLETDPIEMTESGRTIG